LSHEKKFPPYSGVANLVAHFENPQDTPPPHKIKTLEEYKEEKVIFFNFFLGFLSN
jgi:hypothetical protein